MVTAKIIKTEFNYPVFSVFVNFSDDKNILPQPQVQQLTFSAETFDNLDKISLEGKIKEYIDLYELSLAKVDSLSTEINKEYTINGEVVK